MTQVPLFKACDKAFLNQLTEKIKLRIYAPEDMVGCLLIMLINLQRTTSNSWGSRLSLWEKREMKCLF